MKLENSFVVSSPVDRAWEYLLDVENIAPCMPGAELTETIDERNWRGRLKIKFGPVAMAFEGKIEMVERDDVTRQLRLRGAGKDQRGRGSASADIHVAVEPGAEPDTTSVSVLSDLKVSGQIAQFGRSMIQDVSEQMTKKFADSLQTQLQPPAPVEPGSDAPPQTRPEPPKAEAVQGFRLLAGLIGRAIARQFRKLRAARRERVGARRGR